ncbi:MAG: HDOD domain-containing protein [Gammaproteobacteria bacterium]|nr:HDOD domain-containing protein [Gammaproteobacteria bacterium]
MTVCLNELNELPPLSSSAREILKIIHDDDADIAHFSQIVERDPALLSRTIGLANSAYFGNRAVTDVQRAIIDVLGLRTAKNIVLGVVLGGIFNPKSCKAFDLPRYWFVSLMTATLARDIAIGLKMTSLDANEAYLSGMLNEIGLMALAYLYPAEMGSVLSDSDTSIYESENELFGQNHYDISARFLNDWQLPEFVTDVMLESSLNSKKECSNLCHIIYFANTLSNMIYDDSTINISEMNIPDIVLDEAHLIDSIIKNASGQVDAYRDMANLLS